MSYRLRVKVARFLIRLGRIRAWRWLVGAVHIALGAGSRRQLDLAPINDLEPVPGEPRSWTATGDDPAFASRDLYVRIPKGWCHLDARLVAEEGTRAAVFVDTGKGFDPQPLLELDNDRLDGARGLVRIPATTQTIRLDPVDRSGAFALGSVTLIQASLAAQLAPPLSAAARHAGAGLRRALRGARAVSAWVVIAPGRAVVRFLAGIVLAVFQRSRPTTLSLEPEKQLAAMPGTSGRWHALGADPRFRLIGGRLPRGWCEVSSDLRCDVEPEPELYCELRRGKTVPASARWLSAREGIVGRAYVPWTTRQLFWRPIRTPATFHQDPSLVLKPVGGFGQVLGIRARLSKESAR